MKLSPSQIEVIDAPPGNLCILACAGSGKTTVLARRIARLINSKIAAPSEVVAITFTVLAAQRLTLKIAELLTEKLWASQVYAGTIHAFALELLRKIDESKADRLRVISESQQFILLHKFWNEWKIADVCNTGGKLDVINDLITTFGIIKTERLPHSSIETRHPSVANAFRCYNQFLVDNDYVDYSDLIMLVVNALETDAAILEKCRSEYRWFFIDEYQDTDPLQERLFRLLSGNNNLCVVGDDDQSIYQFRGTDVNNILNFSEHTPSSTTRRLEDNFRCRNNILAVASHVVERNTKRYTKKMRASRKGGVVVTQQFHHVDDEASFIVSTIKALLTEGKISSYQDVAILIRSVASSGEHYINALRAANIPYISKGDRGLFRRVEAEQLLGSLEFIAKEANDVAILSELESFISIEKHLIQSSSKDISDCSEGELHLFGLSDDNVATVRALLTVKARYQAGKFTALLDIVIEVLSKLRLFSSDDPTVLYNLSRITQVVNEFDEIEQTKKLHRLCNYLQTYARRSFDEATPVESAVNAVSVLTIHQAKGLEFAVVFCPMMVEGRFPISNTSRRWFVDDDLFDAERYSSGSEDERRLCYVAMTRARDFLFATCAEMIPGLKRAKVPSTFFTEAQSVALPEPSGVILPDASYRNDEFPLVTSYSAIEYYLTCPYRYLLLRVYGFATPETPFFEYGQSIHRVLRIMHDRYREHGCLDDSTIQNIYDSNFKMRFNVPKYIVIKKRAAGIKALKKYYVEKRKWFEDVRATELDFEYYISGAVVRGRIDLLRRYHDNVNEIIDFKTGEPHESLRTDLQMQIYCLATSEQLREPVGQATLYYIEQGQEKPFSVEDEWLESGKVELAKAITGIRDGQFNATPGDPCGRCEVKTVCKYAV